MEHSPSLCSLSLSLGTDGGEGAEWGSNNSITLGEEWSVDDAVMLGSLVLDIASTVECIWSDCHYMEREWWQIKGSTINK